MSIPFEQMEKEEAALKSKELLLLIVQKEIAKLYKAPIVVSTLEANVYRRLMNWTTKALANCSWAHS